MTTPDETQPTPGRLLSIGEVTHQTSLSPATIYRRIADGSFPKSYPAGGRRVVWIEADIDRWKQEVITGAANSVRV